MFNCRSGLRYGRGSSALSADGIESLHLDPTYRHEQHPGFARLRIHRFQTIVIISEFEARTESGANRLEMFWLLPSWDNHLLLIRVSLWDNEFHQVYHLHPHGIRSCHEDAVKPQDSTDELRRKLARNAAPL